MFFHFDWVDCPSFAFLVEVSMVPENILKQWLIICKNTDTNKLILSSNGHVTITPFLQ